MPPKTIRIVPNLSIAALQAKLDKQLAMWYCLRSINQWGSGYLELEYAIKALVAEFGYSRSASYHILSSGDGVFWKIHPLRNVNRLQVKIYGLKKVAEYFDIRCGRYFLEIPVEEFVGHRGNRVIRQRAWLYASFHKPNGTKSLPISRASIREATGVNRRSQQRYDKISVSIVPNFADRQDADGNITPIFDAHGTCPPALAEKSVNGNLIFDPKSPAFPLPPIRNYRHFFVIIDGIQKTLFFIHLFSASRHACYA